MSCYWQTHTVCEAVSVCRKTWKLGLNVDESVRKDEPAAQRLQPRCQWPVTVNHRPAALTPSTSITVGKKNRRLLRNKTVLCQTVSKGRTGLRHFVASDFCPSKRLLWVCDGGNYLTGVDSPCSPSPASLTLSLSLTHTHLKRVYFSISCCWRVIPALHGI